MARNQNLWLVGGAALAVVGALALTGGNAATNGGRMTAQKPTLVARESNFNPNDTQGPAWGLMQITNVALRGFIENTGESLTRRDLLDPETNVRIGTDVLRRIIASYNRNHPQSLATDWDDRRWVELLVAGWNAGWSKKAGVQRVVAYLEERRLPVTIDQVFANAQLAGGVRFLSMAQRFRWWRSVADLYLAERALDAEAVV